MKTIIFSLTLFILIACNDNRNTATSLSSETEKIKQADINFSALSRDSGLKKAFLKYRDSDAVLLRPGHFPIVGDASRTFLENINDSSFTLTWIPSDGVVAKSGELGYTYGVYTFHDKQKDSSYQGTYVSVWKKQADGSWKYVLDTGNPGVDKK